MRFTISSPRVAVKLGPMPVKVRAEQRIFAVPVYLLCDEVVNSLEQRHCKSFLFSEHLKMVHNLN